MPKAGPERARWVCSPGREMGGCSSCQAGVAAAVPVVGVSSGVAPLQDCESQRYHAELVGVVLVAVVVAMAV